MLMPAIRATELPLTLLVTRVLADHENRAVAADDLALLTHGLDRGSDLHGSAIYWVFKEKGARSPGDGSAPLRPVKHSRGRPAEELAQRPLNQAARTSSARCQGVRILGPSDVIATVCSKWAAREPSCE